MKKHNTKSDFSVLAEYIIKGGTDRLKGAKKFTKAMGKPDATYEESEKGTRPVVWEVWKTLDGGLVEYPQTIRKDYNQYRGRTYSSDQLEAFNKALEGSGIKEEKGWMVCYPNPILEKGTSNYLKMTKKRCVWVSLISNATLFSTRKKAEAAAVKYPHPKRSAWKVYKIYREIIR